MKMINFMQNNAKHVEFSVFYLLKICVLSFFLDIIKYSTMREKTDTHATYICIRMLQNVLWIWDFCASNNYYF